MNYSIFSFTEKGRLLEKRLCTIFFQRRSDLHVKIFHSKREMEAQIEYVMACDGLIFIGATGIAVRLIAPLVKDKLTDPAVISMDEQGQFVIPLLSGHVGGANELALEIAEEIGAVPVITTATDINHVIAIDELAKANGLIIKNRDNIKKVSGGLLKGIPQNIAIADDVVITGDESDIDENVLGLIYKPLVVGMGLRRGKELEALDKLFIDTLEELEVSLDMVCAISTIDVKSDEPGLISLSEKYGIPLIFFSAEELNEVEGDFEESEFVKETVGVSDVSARAAKAAGKRGHFILDKKKQDGMTISVFEKYRRITFEY